MHLRIQYYTARIHDLSLRPQWLTNSIAYIEHYFGQSAMHGLLYMVKEQLLLIEKCLWLILLIVSTYYCVVIGLQSVNRYNTKSTVVGLDRDYYNWNTSMPSVTVCPLKRLDLELFDDYCSNHTIDGLRKEEFYKFLESLANSTYSNFKNILSYPSIDGILDELRIKPEHYMQLIYNLTGDRTFKRKEEFQNRGENIRCMTGDDFIYSRQVLTEYGICYMANTYLEEEFSSRYLIFGQIPDTDFGDMKILQVKQGSYFDVDMVYHFLGFHEVAIDAFLHSPFEIMQVDHNLGYTMETKHHESECMEITADEDFEKAATVSQRKCRFQHESNLTHYPIYTKNLCLQECRLNLVYKLCKCIPHFYPNRIPNPKPVCSYKTLRECLPQHEGFFIKLYRINSNNRRETVECNCLQNCLDTMVNKRAEHEMQKSNELMGGNSLILSVIRQPTLRLRRQVIFSFTDLLVSIGGTAGLFLGFSVLGAIEMLYYFSLRLLWYLRGYKI